MPSPPESGSHCSCSLGREGGDHTNLCLGCFRLGKHPEQIQGKKLCEFTKEGDDCQGQWFSGNTCQAGLDFIFGCGGDRMCSIGRSRDVQRACGIQAAERHLVRFPGSLFPEDGKRPVVGQNVQAGV